MTKKVTILIGEGNRGEREVELSKPLITIGRSSGSDIRVSCEDVSARHARLRIYNDYAVLQDLGSRNGVFVDGQRITGDCEVGAGNKITLGEGGPTFQIVSGLPSISTNPTSDDSPASQTPPRKIAIWIAGVIAACFATLMCIVIGGVVVWWSFGRGNTISSISDGKSLREAVGMVIVGYSTTGLETKYGCYSTGTAFAITPDGFLITNKHVIDGVQNGAIKQTIEKKMEVQVDEVKVWVAFDSNLYEADIRYVSSEHDLSILSVSREDMPSFCLSSADTFDQLVDVFVLGYPGASKAALSEEEQIENYLRKYKPKASVKACFKDRDFTYVATNGTVSVISLENGRRWIQHNATMSGGNSGGPLCTEDGTVIGINTQVHSAAPGVNFSIMIDQLRKEIDSVAKNVRWAR